MQSAIMLHMRRPARHKRIGTLLQPPARTHGHVSILGTSFSGHLLSRYWERDLLASSPGLDMREYGTASPMEILSSNIIKT